MPDQDDKPQPTEAQLKASSILAGLAKAIDETFQEQCGVRMGFCMIVFNEEDNGYSSYVANTPRGPTLEAMKALIARLEDPDCPPDRPIHMTEH